MELFQTILPKIANVEVTVYKKIDVNECSKERFCIFYSKLCTNLSKGFFVCLSNSPPQYQPLTPNSSPLGCINWLDAPSMPGAVSVDVLLA